MIYISIILTLIALALLGIAFFIMAIWRAILGKSSIDGKLTTSISLFTKKIESASGNINKHSNSTDNLKTEIKEVKNLLKTLTTKKK